MLSFARIKVVYLPELGGQLTPPPVPYAYVYIMRHVYYVQSKTQANCNKTHTITVSVYMIQYTTETKKDQTYDELPLDDSSTFIATILCPVCREKLITSMWSMSPTEDITLVTSRDTVNCLLVCHRSSLLYLSTAFNNSRVRCNASSSSDMLSF